MYILDDSYVEKIEKLIDDLLKKSEESKNGKDEKPVEKRDGDKPKKP